MQYVNETNTGANEQFVKDELDLSISLNESGSSADLGLDVLRKAAGTGESESEPPSQDMYGPLMNMDE
jgi:hypothetical protein